MGVLLGWLYLNSDRRLAPLPFPVPSSSKSDRQTQKDDARGQGRYRDYPKGARPLCHLCNRSGGYQQCVAALESRDVTIAYASGEDNSTSRLTRRCLSWLLTWMVVRTPEVCLSLVMTNVVRELNFRQISFVGHRCARYQRKRHHACPDGQRVVFLVVLRRASAYLGGGFVDRKR
jgi:hypothetical protein